MNTLIKVLVLAFAFTVGNADKIVGGQDANGVIPYIVNIRAVKNGGVYCGGSLWSSSSSNKIGWVITAAHCQVAVGDWIDAGDVDRTVTTSDDLKVQVTTVTSHPDYGTFGNGNNDDIALLQLQTEITPTSGLYESVNLATTSSSTTGTSITISGWGTLEFQGSQPDILQTVDVNQLANSQCGNYGNSYNSANMVCIGVYAGGEDSCQGDSGGPAVVTGTNTLVGITSFGSGCASYGYPGVYTRVSTYRTWINANDS